MAVVHENHVHLAQMERQSDASVLLCTNRFEALLLSPDGKWLAGWIENERLRFGRSVTAEPGAVSDHGSQYLLLARTEISGDLLGEGVTLGSRT